LQNNRTRGKRKKGDRAACREGKRLYCFEKMGRKEPFRREKKGSKCDLGVDVRRYRICRREKQALQRQGDPKNFRRNRQEEISKHRYESIVPYVFGKNRNQGNGEDKGGHTVSPQERILASRTVTCIKESRANTNPQVTRNKERKKKK